MAKTLIAIGNGTASRESDKLIAELVKKYPALKITKIMVSEAGASVNFFGSRRLRKPLSPISERMSRS
ncbi:MAG TPA: hypothetical protein VM820_15700, partial [Vicinamibacterales bacterium]|nr:hypothetical protein [Vicinamibacterales bacterium]